MVIKNITEDITPSNDWELYSLSETSRRVKMSEVGANIGPQGVDMRSLYRQAGVFSYDPGFANTASCESDITYIDGEKGVLLHRGYSIEQLCEIGRAHV